MESVVKLTLHPDGVAHIEMQEKEGKNTFTKVLIEGIMNVFNKINQTPEAKVVVISGYENFFCMGGTQEELLGIFEGKLKFDDLNFFSALLDCPLPTISAMQGHARGGGLVFGLYADVIILAREALYATNFMNYGFTPGMGATLIVPEKMGPNIGNEMLFSGKNYHGGELQERGVSLEVRKKEEVVATAFALAKQMAEKPKLALMELKKKLTEPLRLRLQDTIQKELKMHEITFAQPEVKERIQALFGN